MWTMVKKRRGLSVVVNVMRVASIMTWVILARDNVEQHKFLASFARTAAPVLLRNVLLGLIRFVSKRCQVDLRPPRTSGSHVWRAMDLAMHCKKDWIDLDVIS
jgi:hypothetical protein